MSTPKQSLVQHNVNEVKLSTRQMWRENGDHRGQVVTCVRGIVWLTHERIPGDYLLTPGQKFVVAQRGLLLAQGLRDAVLKISDPGAIKASLN